MNRLSPEQLKDANTKFKTHRRDAGNRGIPFLFTFEEWITFWLDSGLWLQRGNRKGQYCMSRFNDEGPYAIHNIEIKTHSENIKEARAKEFKEGRQARLGKTAWNKGGCHTEETKQKIRDTKAKKKGNLSSLLSNTLD